MGMIKINNIIYGSNNSADIIYKETTVEDKLNSIPVFDPSDNQNIIINSYDYLTYGHIVDNLTSTEDNKILSANQGKILNDNIVLLDNKINTNISSINTLTNDLTTKASKIDPTLTWHINPGTETEYSIDFRQTGNSPTKALGFVKTDLAGNKNYNTLFDANGKFLPEFWKTIYPVGSVYTNTSNTNPSTFFGGTWSLLKKRCVDTGWQDYSWKNTTYIGTSQSSYNQNKWRIKDNVSYLECGMGATATINTADELEIARIPIKGGHPKAEANRIWTGAVGGSGAVSGMYLLSGTSYWSVKAKPHTSANNHAAPWYSAFFAIALTDDFTFNTGSYVWEYTWRRTA